MMGKKKEYRAYKKLVRRFRRRLKKLAAKTNPYSFEYATEWLFEFLLFMEEYYSAGNNVHGIEREDYDRLVGIRKAISYYKDWRNNDHEDAKMAEIIARIARDNFWKTVANESDYWWD